MTAHASHCSFHVEAEVRGFDVNLFRWGITVITRARNIRRIVSALKKSILVYRRFDIAGDKEKQIRARCLGNRYLRL
jgi:hypothetical protein